MTTVKKLRKIEKELGKMQEHLTALNMYELADLTRHLRKEVWKVRKIIQKKLEG